MCVCVCAVGRSGALPLSDAFQCMWSDNADALSLHYCGTPSDIPGRLDWKMH